MRRPGAEMIAGAAGSGAVPPPCEPLAHRFQDGPAHGHVAVAVVAARDHDPRREAGAGAARELLAGAHEVLVMGDAATIPRARGGSRPGSFLTLPRRLAWASRARKNQSLRIKRALVRQHQLEAVDALELALERELVELAEHERLERVVVPGAEHHADVAVGRQVAPVAPHGRARALLVVGLAVGVGVQVARVEPFVEPLDRLALAGAVGARDQDQHREAAPLLQLELDVEQRLAQAGLLGLEGRPCRGRGAAPPMRTLSGGLPRWRRSRPGRLRTACRRRPASSR